MKRVLQIVLFLLMVITTGCANKIVYPVYKDTVKIAISEKIPSALTDTPAGASVIENSQVFVIGHGNPALIYPVFGLPGLAIQSILNAAEVSDSKSSFRVNFASELSEALQKNSTFEPKIARYNYSVIKSEDLEDVLLWPTVSFTIIDESEARLNFYVKAKFIAEYGGVAQRWYNCIDEKRNLSGTDGWSDDNAAMFNKARSRSFDHLSQVILRDISGEYRVISNQPRIKWKLFNENNTQKSILLYEGDEYFVVCDTFHLYFTIVDRSLGEIVSE